MLEGSILHQLQLAHQPNQIGKRSLNFGVYYKNTLVALCHALEDCILSCSSPPLVITAFQQGKWYLEEADRYAELAEHARQVVILAAPSTGFAEHPTSQRQNVALVPLSVQDPVAAEWHLMILAPTYSAMVLCQELSEADYGPHGTPDQDLERKFYGFWTFENNLVQETVELAIAHIQRYDSGLADQLTAQKEAILAAQPAERDDLTQVVATVVDYLQTSQSTLLQGPSTDTAWLGMLDRNLLSNEVQAFLRMAQLIDYADQQTPRASADVAALAEAMGQLLDLPVWQLHRLKLAGLLHRLAPLQQSQPVLTPGSFGRYDTAAGDSEAAPSCPLVPGAQVLRRMPQLRAIATIITHQTERWDGSGQPAGLAGDEIPLESRILGLVAAWYGHLSAIPAESNLAWSDRLTQALAACQQGQASQWDPKLIDTLKLLISGLQQGMSLPTGLPKISAGLWLLDELSA